MTVRKLRESEIPGPDQIIRFYPDPTAIIRAYVESDFARALATEHERKVAVVTAEGASVSDAATFTSVGERLVDVVAHRREVEDWFAPIRSWLHRAHQAICDRQIEVLKPLVMFESSAKQNIQAWQREQDRIRRDEEQRLAELARREEQERFAREAELLEQRGEPELAQQVLEQAVHAPAPVIVLTDTVPDVKGMSFRSNWHWRPIGGDTPANRARAEKLVPREMLELSDRKLNAYAKAHGASARMPGIEFYDAGSVAVRT